MNEVLSWLLIPYEALHYLWTTAVFGIGTALSWLHDGIATTLSWLRIPYDALWALSYFWLRAVFGIATGLLIARKIVGLSVCVLGNAALYFCADWNPDPSLNLMGVAHLVDFGVVACRPNFALGYSDFWLSVCRRSCLGLVAAHHRAASHHPGMVAWIGLVVTAAAPVIFSLHFLLDDRLALLLDDWRFRRSLR